MKQRLTAFFYSRFSIVWVLVSGLLGVVRPCQAQIPSAYAADSLVLLKFQSEMRKAGWPALWKVSDKVYFWKGITLDPATGYVKEVALLGRNLSVPYKTDSLPASISILKELKALKGLDFGFLDLKYIPPQIGDFSELEGLGFGYNQLETLPPEITKLKKLTYLFLHQNRFKTLPDLSELTGLKRLDIDSNPLLTSIPSSVFKLKSLVRLLASYCPFTHVPAGIGDLVNLEELDLDAGQIASIDPAIGKLKKLAWFNISNNKLTSLPKEIDSLTALVNLDVSYNQLSQLPASLSQLPKLQGIQFNNNRFTTFPSPLLSISTLVALNGSDNQMSGSIPKQIWSRNNVVQIFLNNNHFSGPLEIADPSRVSYCYIAGNRFVFADLDPVYGALKRNRTFIEINPQQKIGTVRTVIPAAGQTLSIDLDGYTHLAGSVYQWFFKSILPNSGPPVVVGTGSILTLPNFNPATQGGFYYCKVTHASVAELTLESNLVRVIGNNQPPIFFADPIVFRRGKPSNLELYPQDDYTPSEQLITSVSQPTHLVVREAADSRPSFVKLLIEAKDPTWVGSDTLLISVKDEYGLTTTHRVPVTILPETNKPPVLAAMPSIYTVKEVFACDNPQECDSIYFWSSSTILTPYLSDDLDPLDQLTLRIDAADSAQMAKNEIIFDLSTTSFLGMNDWRLNIDLFTTKDTVFTDTVTIHIYDREGGVSSGKVLVIFGSKSNQPPTVLPIPEQVIVKGTTQFPLLDLTPFATDDHNLPKDLKWILWLSPTDKLTGEVTDNKASIRPKFTDQAGVYSLNYSVQDLTNAWSYTNTVIQYRILEKGVRISGKVQTDQGQPVPQVLVRGFANPVYTDAQGVFSVEVVPGWSGVAEPVLAGYTFSPPTYTYTAVQSEQLDQLYTAKGTVTGIEANNHHLLSVYPVPSYGQVYIQLAQPATKAGQLRIYTPQGQLLRQYGVRAGTKLFHWDGRDASAQEVGSGMYFCQLVMGNDVVVRKIVLLR